MRLDNFQIEFVTEDFGGSARQGKKGVYADAEIGSENDRQRFGGFFNEAPLLRRMSSGADNKWTSSLQCRTTNAFDRPEQANLHSDIAVLHGRCDVITKITLSASLYIPSQIANSGNVRR